MVLVLCKDKPDTGTGRDRGRGEKDKQRMREVSAERRGRSKQRKNEAEQQVTLYACMFFFRQPEKVQAAIDRYKNETMRLYSVLDEHLAGKDYICDDVCDTHTLTYMYAELVHMSLSS